MIKIYNTLFGKKEIFKPKNKKLIRLFVCGPTVYDASHIGHARTYLVFDMIVKYLRQKGYNVFYLQNITDLDDKIINRAKEKKIIPRKLARDFEKEYLKDMKTLKVDSVTEYARATDYIKEIISQTKRLLEKGYAYQIKDGIYYDISKFKNYGKLSGRTVQQAEDAISRIDENINKKNKGDFILWKISKPGEPKWSSPWGYGRPGWHIEDTAITEKIFGPQYDIHGGGEDLIIPHHEAEIAQMEAISGKKPLVKYWLHTSFLNVGGKKMSKSLGNFTAIKDFIGANSARILRFFVLKSHYRSPIDYTDNSVSQAEKELEKIDEFVGKLTDFRNPHGYLGCPTSPKIKGDVGHPDMRKFQKQFKAAMEDDFNTPKAMAAIFEIINHGNALMTKGLLTKADAKNILEFLKKNDKFFDFIFWPKQIEKPPQKLFRLMERRQEYRKQKNWHKADETRSEIVKLGWQVEDTPIGQKLKRISGNSI